MQLVIATYASSDLALSCSLLIASLETNDSCRHHWFVSCDRETAPMFAGLPRVRVISPNVLAKDGPFDPLSLRGASLLAAFHSGAAAIISIDPRVVVVRPFISELLDEPADVCVIDGCRRNGVPDMIAIRGPRASGVVDLAQLRSRRECVSVIAELGGTGSKIEWCVSSAAPRRVDRDVRLIAVDAFARPESIEDIAVNDQAVMLDAFDFLTASASTYSHLVTFVCDLDRSGFYRTILNDRVEVLTHCDPSRVEQLVALTASTPPQVRVLCAVNGTADDLAAMKRRSELSSKVVLIPCGRRSPYPFNRLRNAALRQASAQYVMWVDVDFVLLRGFWYFMIGHNTAILAEGHCICPMPLAEKRSADLSMTRAAIPTSSAETDAIPLFRYHGGWHPRTSANAGQCVDITDRLRLLRHTAHPAEPWGMIRRDRCVRADEEFVGRGGDKQQLVAAQLDRGTRFFASTAARMFHIWHEKSIDSDSERGNVVLWKRRYQWKAHRYLVILGPRITRLTEGVASLCREIAQVCAATASVERANYVWAPDGVQTHRAIESGARLIVSPAPLAPNVGGYGYRILVIVQHPLVGEHDGVVGSEGFGDELVRTFASGRPDLLEASANSTDVAAVLDLDDRPHAERVVSNILGVDARLPGWSGAGPTARERAMSRHDAWTADLLFYSKLREWFGFGCEPDDDAIE